MAERSTSSWARGTSGIDHAGALAPLEHSLTVASIATPRSEFKTCSADERLADVVQRNIPDHFDFLPVIEPIGDGRRKPHRIIGLIGLVPFQLRPIDPGELVSTNMRPLSEENLIGADASILAYVRAADRQQCRLVVSGLKISGLVSLSDLQRLPVRAALFTMVTHLEMVMADFIRKDCGHPTEWMPHLSSARQEMIREKVDKARENDSFVDELLFTQFADKITIIKKHARLAPSDKPQFKKELERVHRLRDALAHANDYAANRETAVQACETVRMIDRWILEFTRWLGEKPNSAPAGSASI